MVWYKLFKADPPDTSKIPTDDAVGVTVILITASYRGQEFVRVGYYVNNDYEDPELKDNPPAEPIFDKLVRTIAADQPRVTKFKINWDPVTNEAANTINEANPATAGVVSQDSEMMIAESGEKLLNGGNEADAVIAVEQ